MVEKDKEGIKVDIKHINGLNERDILKKAQRKRAVTQETLAQRIGVKRNALNQNMNRSRMSLNTFIDVLNAMDYDIVIVDRETGEAEWKIDVPDRDLIDEDI